MRLLHTSTLELCEFQGNRIPNYAILSHTWGDEEVKFEDISNPEATKLAGYRKIEGFCRQAASESHEYAWVDTCCIDKRSSAELSEAINSMYTWYAQAQVCYVHLADVYAYEDGYVRESQLSQSKWFKRGWTLQELLAPMNVVFFDANWVEIGTKTSMGDLISKITGIEVGHLTNETRLEDVCVAVKFSWAADRVTTRAGRTLSTLHIPIALPSLDSTSPHSRTLLTHSSTGDQIEDVAYGLMGIFGVHMPLLYGEGQKAFLRLQHEIISMTNDPTILAWNDPQPYHKRRMSPLAIHPNFFRRFRGAPYTIWTEPHATFSVTNRGIHIDLFMKTLKTTKSLAFLNCGMIVDGESKCFPIVLVEESPNVFTRIVRTDDPLYLNYANRENSTHRTIHLSNPKVAMEPAFQCSVRVTQLPPFYQHFVVVQHYPVEAKDSRTNAGCRCESQYCFAPNRWLDKKEFQFCPQGIFAWAIKLESEHQTESMSDGFIAVFWINSGRVYTEIIFPEDFEHWEAIHQDYETWAVDFAKSNITRPSRRPRDRVTRLLPDGRSVFVGLNRDHRYNAQIRVSNSASMLLLGSSVIDQLTDENEQAPQVSDASDAQEENMILSTYQPQVISRSDTIDIGNLSIDTSVDR